MKISWLVLIIGLYSTATLAHESLSELERGQQSEEFYAGLFGQIIGVVYGVSIAAQDNTFCLNGNEEENIVAIRRAIENNVKTVTFGYLPNKENSLAFLRLNFPCK